jgi:diguanylate cyclase (GGDEF)-like protein
MPSDDLEFQQCAELLLGKRLVRYREALDEIARGLGDPDQSGPFARGKLANEWMRKLQMHAEDTLSNVLTLMRTFDARSPEWLQQSLDGYVDELSTEVAERLREGGSGRSAEQRQVTNLAASVKARAREDIALAFEMAARLRERTDDGPSGALDGLLPLHQRAVFDRDLERLVKAATSEEPFSLVMIDLDHFKRVNDEHGHQSGDQVLIGVATILISCLSQKGKAYRYGGEELAVLLPNYSVDESVGFGERIRKRIESAVLGKKGLKVTASLGLAAAPLHASDAEALLERADAALYDAKHGGRNRLCVAGAK